MSFWVTIASSINICLGGPIDLIMFDGLISDHMSQQVKIIPALRKKIHRLT